MADLFQSFVTATINDDRVRVKELLKQNEALVKAGAPQARLESRIPH